MQKFNAEKVAVAKVNESYQICNDSRIPRIIFRYSLLHFPNKICPNISCFCVYSTTQLGKQCNKWSPKTIPHKKKRHWKRIRNNQPKNKLQNSKWQVYKKNNHNCLLYRHGKEMRRQSRERSYSYMTNLPSFK